MLDATKVCCERWGIAKVTIDDIAAEAGVSRATLYRMFPGGKDVLFDALRVHELEAFFTELGAHIDGGDDLEDLLVRTVVYATNALRNDEHLAIMLASEPGDTLANLTVQGLPRIIRMASLFLSAKVEPYLDRGERGPARRTARPTRHLVLPRAVRPRRPRGRVLRPRLPRHPHPSDVHRHDPALTRSNEPVGPSPSGALT